MDLLFLSFTALSGFGLGDIVPLGAGAKAIVMLEEFAGVMYLALVVSRLIAMMRSRQGCVPALPLFVVWHGAAAGWHFRVTAFRMIPAIGREWVEGWMSQSL